DGLRLPETHRAATERTFLHFGHRSCSILSPENRLMPHECFVDEIAIDFPSVGRAVERMRDAFLGEPDADGVLLTEVSLSPREASGGLLVKVDVPVRSPPLASRGERSEEHTSELQSRENLVCRLLLEKKN